MINLLYILIGLVAGSISGLIGIGGGIIVVPALVYLFGFSQHMAQGTTLAMLVPPIGLLAAWTYYKQGHVNFLVAGLLCLGFILGSYFGAKLAIGFSPIVLRKIFGIALMAVSIYIIIK